MSSGGHEIRLCREVNPMYRGKFKLFCNFGMLSYETSECVTQWDQMENPPWTPRSKHSAVSLSDGSLLLLGGIGGYGPLREVWQWTPRPPPELGAWGVLPEPPWPGRFGAGVVRMPSPPPPPAPIEIEDSTTTIPNITSATARLLADAPLVPSPGAVASGDDQVVLIGGNDGLNRRDVWQWDRAASLVPIYLDSGYAVGTQIEDCTVTAYPTILQCVAAQGVIGRRWDIASDVLASATEKRLQQATELQLELRHFGGAGAAILALQIDGCRLLFELSYKGVWTCKACGDGDPRIWNRSGSSRQLGPSSATTSGQWQMLKITLDRISRQVIMTVDGNSLLPVNMDTGVVLYPEPTSTTTTTATSTATTNLVGQCQADQALVQGGVCGAAPTPAAANAEYERGDPSALLSIEVAVWPESTLEVRNINLMALPGNWRLLAGQAPWEARNSHAVAALPSGDLLLMGGLGSDGLLADVWRWTPQRCTLLPDTGPVQAVYYELECTSTCIPSVPHGQWVSLGRAPWLPRQGHTALYTGAGIIMAGGRTDDGFVSDVWRYVSYGSFCSLDWKGRWEELVQAAAWAPRYGHTLVGFAPSGGEIETVLLLGGFGGHELPEHVTRTPIAQPIEAHNDIWCGYMGEDNFTTWMQLTPTSPFSKRANGVAVIAPTIADYAFLFFGGYDTNSRDRGDFWRWQGENATATCKMQDDYE